MAPEKDISLGEFLRQERERRGITIEQVASATKVGVRTLHSLEADHFAELPAKPFIRGFVTSYCRFIGLDPKEILARFDDFMSYKANERPNRETGHSGYAFEKKDGEQQSRTILMIAMCSFILLGALAMLFLKPSLRHQRSSHIDKLRAVHQNSAPEIHLEASPVASGVPQQPQVITSPTVKVSVPAAKPSMLAVEPSVMPVSTPSSVPSIVPSENQAKMASPGVNPSDPLDSGHDLKSNEITHKAIVKALMDIWVRYQVDDRPIRKFIVRQGRTLFLRAKSSIRLQVSNPNSATVSYNGRAFKLVSSFKGAALKQGNTTLFFPLELAEKIEKPFGEVKPLPEIENSKPDSFSQKEKPNP
jgi:cytoskeletal protein RodZ